MGIDQARQQRSAGAVDRLGAVGDGVGPGREARPWRSSRRRRRRRRARGRVSARPSISRTSANRMAIETPRYTRLSRTRRARVVDNLHCGDRAGAARKVGEREAAVTGRRVGDAIVEVLRAASVDTVFGIPGIHTLGLYDALAGTPSIRHILTRHEQGAAFAADGYARSAGRPGVLDDDRARARSTPSPRSPRPGRTRRRSSSWPARSTPRSMASATGCCTRRPTRAVRSRR